MAASPSVDDSFTFVGGLYTEGLFFLTPKNSWKEGDNVVPRTDGSIIRRSGIDYEENYQINPVSISTSDINNFAFCVETWSSVGGNGNLDFFVVQQGATIEFYKAFSGTVGAGKLSASINLNDYKCFGNTSVIGTNVITAASCYGRLIITSIDTNPILVTYNATTDSITHQALELKIRDFDGIRSPAPEWAEFTEDVWQSTYAFGTEARYNLYNQGWTLDKLTAFSAANNNLLPANTKQWWYGKNTDDNFDPALLNKNDFGTSLAPRGRFVLNAFYQDRASAIGVTPPGNYGPSPPTPTVPDGPNDNDFTPIPPYGPGTQIP
jgi:hypothetical protein